MMRERPIRRATPSEEGYILVAVMFMLALIIIALAVAAPKVAADIQRDRELETYHRGMQYRRAVQLYYRKFNRYPPNVDALVKTNEIRYLRKKYKDPTTGKDDWKPVMCGQQKTPMAMGFFGQPLMGGPCAALIGGVGLQGGNGVAGASTLGSSSGLVDANGNPVNADGSSAANQGATTTGAASAGTANPTDPNAGGANGSSSSIGGSTNPAGGQTFGGAGIVGFSPASPKDSILVYKKKNHYQEWEFTYSPLSDQGVMGMMPSNPNQPSIPGVGAPGTPYSPGGSGSPIGASPSPIGSSPSPTPTPSPTPQQ